MSRWVRIALFIAVPCFCALMMYDAVAVFLLRQDEYRVRQGQAFVRGLFQDLALAAVYAATVTPRVLRQVPERWSRATSGSLIMLGLGIAWYDVLCAFVTRLLPDPPDVAVGIVVLFVIPMLLAPWYYRWLQGRFTES